MLESRKWIYKLASGFLNASPAVFETQKWFKLLVVAMAFALVWVCWFVVRSALPVSAVTAQFGLLVLMIGALGGWVLVIGKLLPLVLTRVWPKLDSSPN